MYELPPLPKKKKPKAPYRKPDAVKELGRQVFEAACTAHPNVPRNVVCPRTFRDNTSSGLAKCIVAYVTLRGGFCTRVNSMGVYRASLGRYTYSGQKRGLADVVGTYKSQSLHIELKIGRDELSPQQEKVRDEQRQAGGLWYEAHDFTSFQTWFDSI